MSPGMVVGAVGIGVVVDVGIGVGVVVDVGIGIGVVVDVGIGVGIGAGKDMDSTTPSSWTDGHGGDVALGGLSLTDPPCGGVGEREWTTQLVLLSFVGRPHIRVVVIRRNSKHPLAFVKRGSGRYASCSQRDCNNGRG